MLDMDKSPGHRTVSLASNWCIAFLAPRNSKELQLPNIIQMKSNEHVNVTREHMKSSMAPWSRPAAYCQGEFGQMRAPRQYGIDTTLLPMHDVPEACIYACLHTYGCIRVHTYCIDNGCVSQNADTSLLHMSFTMCFMYGLMCAYIYIYIYLYIFMHQARKVCSHTTLQVV